MVDWCRVGAVFMGAALLAGCTQDDGPLSPGRDLTPGSDAAQAALVCQVDVKAGSMACIPESPALPAGVAGAVLGGQGKYVELEAANVTYDAVQETFSADVTVRNLVTQSLGTADGVTVDPNGIRVFFVEPPAATAGSGVVEVTNSDGLDTFVGSDHPYFQYAQVLTPGKVSLPRTWQFGVPAEVTSFTFKVYVAAMTANDEGIEPGLHFNAQTISAGDFHSCGLTLGGAAYCWGSAGDGQLGNGKTDNANTPESVQAPAGTKFVAISARESHTCGVTTTGAAYCWGRDTYGRLGNNENSGKIYPPDLVKALADVKFVAISAGNAHTCGLASTGTSYCWGNGGFGQLGNAGFDNATTPDSVRAPAGTKFVAISAGSLHTCGVTTTGAAYCWGLASNGRLGNDVTSGNKFKPDSVHAPAGAKFIAISAGSAHTCGITTTGAAYCWGAALNGRLGNDVTSGNVTKPDSVHAPAGTKFIAISAGESHTCGVTSTGMAYCWGLEQYGRLGNGGTLSQNVPKPDSVHASAGTKFVAISAGKQHTCGVISTGTAYCWGYELNDGRLGNGGKGSVAKPLFPVSTVTNFALVDPRVPVDGAGRLLPARTSFEMYARRVPARCTIAQA